MIHNKEKKTREKERESEIKIVCYQFSEKGDIPGTSADALAKRAVLGWASKRTSAKQLDTFTR